MIELIIKIFWGVIVMIWMAGILTLYFLAFLKLVDKIFPPPKKNDSDNSNIFGINTTVTNNNTIDTDDIKKRMLK
jgi:hypothetical protein